MLATDRVLVIAAHPDDEVLGCGGTVARLAQEGHPVHIAIMAEGITSRHAQRDQADAKQLSRLHQQAHAAAAKMGAQDVQLLKLPDNRLDTVPLLDVVKLVEGLVEKLSPQVIYTHHSSDLNVDHGLINRAVLTATRPMAGGSVNEIYSFEVPSSTEWSFHQLAPPFRPNVFIEIADTLETKIAAMACYDSEIRDSPHPRSPDVLRAIALRWGSVVGCAAAEAFELVRSIRPVFRAE